MIEHIWTIICSRSIVDKRTNNISLIDVLEQVNVGSFAPLQAEEGIVPLQFDIVSLWGRGRDGQPDKGHVRIIMVLPTGKRIEPNPGLDLSVDLTKHQRTRTITRVEGFPVVQPGRHVFIVQIEDDEGWKDLASLPIEILFEPPKQN
ncbi:MAG: hypothetical protein HY326_10155 [Chloroflexi bacterium]|nr:hypothetical protein [Chloroflexota bacterium]